MPHLIVARWPLCLVAVLEAIAGRAMGGDFALRITPKGGGDQKRFPMRIAATAIIAGVLVAVGTMLTARELALMDPNA
ncbi:MAG: hypothetical protein J2P57_03075, partial [Acidimicrobiaceae bacterium]|nr:hypothetical protein [Acidimicrobiaceae bacterium]